MATYFGGSANESSWAIALDDAGNVYLAGYTASPDFPMKKGSAFEKFNGGNTDGFIMRLDKNLSSDKYKEFHDAAKRIKKRERWLFEGKRSKRG